MPYSTSATKSFWLLIFLDPEAPDRTPLPGISAVSSGSRTICMLVVCAKGAFVPTDVRGPGCLWSVCTGVSEGATVLEEGSVYPVCKLVLTPPELLVPPPPSLIASLVLIEGLSHASALAVWSELPPSWER